MIKDRLTKMTDMQNYIKINDLSYSSTKNNYNFNNYSLLIVLLTYINMYIRYEFRKLVNFWSVYISAKYCR